MLWPVGSNSGCLWYELNLFIEILFGVPCPIHHTFFCQHFITINSIIMKVYMIMLVMGWARARMHSVLNY